jgi:ammonium transporter, Amt family
LEWIIRLLVNSNFYETKKLIKTKFDVLWVIICSGLVFFMQAGFLCLESGLTRTKNSINVAIKNITDFGIATILFYSIGFGMMFGESRFGFIGTDLFLPDFSIKEPGLPVYFLFQLMFCGTAATIVSGAVAERMRYGAYIVVTILISAIIYPIFGHWAWGKNLLDHKILYGWLAQRGFIDFAGSTVVHSVGGWIGLVSMYIIGPRMGKFDSSGNVRPIQGHNLPIAMLGTMILWFGWIGFNGGSTFLFSEQIPRIIVNTMLSGAGGMASALIFGWFRLGYAEATLPLNGVLAGLVSITAGCFAVSSVESLIIGVIGGILMLETRLLLERFQLDDAVGAIPVHLAGGIWGTLAVGLFGNPFLLQTGLSKWQQISVQLLGISVCGFFSLSIGFIFLSLVNRFYRLRISENKEREGLNYSEHRATTELVDLIFEMDYQKRTGDLSKDVSVEPFTEVGQIAERYNLVLNKIRKGIEEREALNLELEKHLELIQSDLITAKKIQTAILGFSQRQYGKLYISAEYLPLTEVGGDFYDITQISPTLTRIFLADSTGHGVQAALITMAIKVLYDSLKRGKYSVGEVLFYLNNEFIESFERLNQFFTCVIIDIDTEKNILTYASGGHPAQYISDKGKIIRLEKTGRMLGVMNNTGHAIKKLSFKPGAGLFLFTDGLTEEWNLAEEEFGEKKLESLLIQRKNLKTREISDNIIRLQNDFLQGQSRRDDMTIITVDYE